MKRRTLIISLTLLAAIALTLMVTGSTVAAQTSSALWFVSYWDNPDLEGDPVASGSEGMINHDWGSGSPAPNVHPDTWSARWSAFVDFSAGTYRFSVTSDDGVGVFLGDKHIINDWTKHGALTHIAVVSLKGGRYPMAVDYFDDIGNAVLKVSWERTGPPSPSAADVTVLSSGPSNLPPPVPGTPLVDWRGEYFNNASLAGAPVLVRTDLELNFNWSGGSPATGLPSDNFSVRWTRSLNLVPGRYRFTAISDDGSRLWVNNQLVIDRWYDHPAQSFPAEVDWPGGFATVRFEYYERGGLAQVSLGWERIGSAGQTGGAATATVNVAWLNARSGPGAAFQRITTLPFGTPVGLLARNAEATWAQVTLPDGRQAWMYAGYLSSGVAITSLPVAGTPQPGPGTGAGATATVIRAQVLNVRQGPGVTFAILTHLRSGDVVTLAGFRNADATWVKVNLASGMQGWVHTYYLQSSVPFNTLPIGG